MKYDNFDNYFLSNNRSSEGDSYINELERRVRFDRSTQFDRALLTYIRHNPTLTIRQAWEDVEDFFSNRNRIPPKPYPFEFDN